MRTSVAGAQGGIRQAAASAHSAGTKAVQRVGRAQVRHASSARMPFRSHDSRHTKSRGSNCQHCVLDLRRQP